MYNYLDNVYKQWTQYRESNPQSRHFDAARNLGLPEEALVAARCGMDIRQLEPKFDVLFENLESLGRLMALTRNPHAVIEKEGVYRNVSINGKVGLVLDSEIDLRLFLKHWSSLYAIDLKTSHSKLKGFYIFDHDGIAVHKIYLTDESNLAEYEALIAKIGLKEPEFTPKENKSGSSSSLHGELLAKSQKENNVKQFLQAWASMQDTHDFLTLMRKYELSRYQALNYALDRFTRKIDPNKALQVMEAAAEKSVPIMIFVGNKACIEIHSGPIYRCVSRGNWFNILDKGFSLHLNTTGIHDAFFVEKPTKDGIVSSLEIFDHDGELIMQIFGQRKADEPELKSWRELANLNT